MAISKDLVSTPLAKVTVSEAGGAVKLQVELGADLGGGKAAGVLQGKATMELDVEGKQIIDLGLDLAAAKFPAAAAMIEAAKAIIDSQLANV